MEVTNPVGETNTLIIGAGPAGLAVAACLKQRDVPFILLEQGDRVGRAWHDHYDRLHPVSYTHLDVYKRQL